MARLCTLLVLGLIALLPLVAVVEGDETDDRSRHESLTKIAEAARRLELTPERCPSSPAAAAQRVGGTVEDVVRFVREEIEWQPYLGAVRGPEGTLAARSGSDWDRALLLRSMLDALGHRSRFAVLARSEAERRSAVDGYPGFAMPSVAAGEGELSPFSRALGVTPEARADRLARGAARWEGLLDEAEDAAAFQAGTLHSLLLEAELGTPAGEALDAELLAGAGERVAVELLVRGTERILTLGPDDPGAEAWSGARRRSTVPNDRRAVLEVRMESEVRRGDAAPRTEVLLRRRFFADEIFCAPIRCQIAPLTVSVGRKPPQEWGPEENYRLFETFDRFQAVLIANGEAERSEVFDLKGRRGNDALEGRPFSPAGAAAGIGAALGAAGTTTGAESGGSDAEPRVTALTLRVDFRRPGVPPLTARRLVCGELLPDASPVWHADLVLFAGPVDGATIAWQTLDSFTSSILRVESLLIDKDPNRFRHQDDAAIMPMLLHRWQAGRLALAARQVADASGLRVLPGPALVMQTTRLVGDEEAQAIKRRISVDVVHDGLRLLPEASGGANAVRANLELGIASTVLESILLRSRSQSEAQEGAYAAFEEAAAAGHTPTIGAASPAPVSQWAIEQNERGRIQIFPGDAQPRAWWSIDPSTGAAIGRAGAGEGQGAQEYIETTFETMKDTVSQFKCFQKMQGLLFTGESAYASTWAYVKCAYGLSTSEVAGKICGAAQGFVFDELGIGIVGTMADVIGLCEDVGNIGQTAGGFTGDFNLDGVR